MRIWGTVCGVALLCAGCEIRLFDDWESGEPMCSTTGCGADQVELDLAIPISDEHLQRTDLWVSVCHAGACAKDVHLEWSCEGDFTCKLACEANAKLLGGEITARRGGSCPGSDRLCVQIELPTAGLEPGNTDVTVTLDDAVSGRRLVDRTFAVELTERTARTCSGVEVCLQGQSDEAV